MLQNLEEAKGIAEEPISHEEREKLRELREQYTHLRERASERSHKRAGLSAGGARSCSENSESEDDDDEEGQDEVRRVGNKA